jgi:hypothetical protein
MQLEIKPKLEAGRISWLVLLVIEDWIPLHICVFYTIVPSMA